MNNWQSGFVDTNGIRAHYIRTGGDKPPFVLAHGFSDDGQCWRAVAEALCSDYDVIMGDIIAVRKHTILVGKISEESEKSIKDIRALDKSQLRKLIIKGNRPLGTFTLYGCLIGGFTGFLIGFASGDDHNKGFMALNFSAMQKAGILVLFLAPIGALIGLATGVVNSTDDKIIFIDGNFYLSHLKDYAKYKGDEPAFLRTIPGE